MTNIQQSRENPKRLLGNTTSYFAKTVNQKVTRSDKEIAKLKYAYKKAKIERKKKIGKKICRISYCGTRTISKHAKEVQIIKGEKGSIYYQGMQRCGSVWFCPDCMYKIMKVRAEELYTQLQIYKAEGKKVLFVTYTLQHHQGDKLESLHSSLLSAFTFANSHRTFIEAKKKHPIEFLRALEVVYGVNGWHPHLHSLFVGDGKVLELVNLFVSLYRKYLLKNGFTVNEHTVMIDAWNGSLNDMTEYLFKGLIEKELTGGNLKSNKGKTFFDLIDEGNEIAVDEYIKVMKGKRQYHSSKNFFTIRIQSDAEILKDDKVQEILYTIPKDVYADIHNKGIALHLLNEYEYGGEKRVIKLLELYDCDTSFIT